MNKSIWVVIATLVAVFGINQANAATNSNSVVFKKSVGIQTLSSVISASEDPTVPPKPTIPPKPTKPKPKP